jgi:hypothetical protein
MCNSSTVVSTSPFFFFFDVIVFGR